MKKIITIIILLCILIGAWFLYSEVYVAQAQYSDSVIFEIEEGQSVQGLAFDLEQKDIIRNATLFKLYARFKGIDRQIRQGEFEVKKPITLARVIESLTHPGISERTITIIPGWDLRDVAEYLVSEGFVKDTEEVFYFTGEPAFYYSFVWNTEGENRFTTLANEIQSLPDKISYEGYLAPNTYRVYKNATVREIIVKLMLERNDELANFYPESLYSSGRTIHEILTMASILEREVKTSKDRKLISDLFWRRYDANWALQADSTVHYAVGKKGNVFTTKEDRDSLSTWNTYKYPGLPPGPICNPSLDAIMAAMYPEKNEYWYFLTTQDGEVKYGRNLEEHNSNIQKFLR